jgi:uncharacterized repeat protein (TIGR01451 family)
MITKNIVTAAIVSTVISAFVATPVYADSYEGVTPPKNLTVNKMVQDPRVKTFVENLGPADVESAYKPGQEVLYRLVIKNDSGETFNPVTVEDTFPTYLTFVSGPGTYDKGANRLFIKVENLIAGQSKTIDILAKVADVKDLPKDKAMFCNVKNHVHVYAPARPDGDQDDAAICIKTGPVPTKLPVAGFNDLMLLLPFAGVGLTGIGLLRKK